MIDLVLLKKLIRLRSDKDNPAAKAQAMHLILHRLNPLIKSKKLRVQKISGGESLSYYFSTHSGKKSDILFYGHLDVVPGLPRNFVPKIEKKADKTRLYGRGALDMKTLVVMQIELLEELINEGIDKSLGLLLTSDEEISGSEGAQKFMADHYQPEVVLMPDGGRNWNLVCDEKGAIWVEVSVCGDPAHGSRPWKGKNALDIFNSYLAQAEKILGQVTAKNRSGISFNLGVVNGGKAYNMVCSDLVAGLDIRYPSETSRTKILIELEKLADSKEFKGKITLKELIHCNPASTKRDHPAIKKIIELTKAETGKDVFPNYSCGASDSRWFTKKNIPVIVMSPDGKDHHGDNEWVDLNSVEKLQNVYRRFIKEY